MDNSEARLDEAIPQRSVILPALPLGDRLTAVPARSARITPVSWSWTSDPNRRVLPNKNLHHAAHDVMTAIAPNVPSQAVPKTSGKGLRVCLLIFQHQADN